MTARTCVTPGCEQTAVARGMCNAHYARARREGRKTEIPAPPEDRPATDYSRAACLDHDPELWFPAPKDDDTRKVAKRICKGCPIRRGCLADAMAAEVGQGFGGRAGIYGGVTSHRRAKKAGMSKGRAK